MKILVTGIAGATGSHIAERLINDSLEAEVAWYKEKIHNKIS
ncbi:MAG: hypothetical protein AAB587_00710 [Patescibacteria group bacterium]